MTSIFRRVATPGLRIVTAHRRKAAFNKLLRQGLPPKLVGPARYLVTGEMGPDVRTVQKLVEAQRRKIASRGKELVNVLYSPKPGSAGSEVTPELRPRHGKVMKFTMDRVAYTGKDKRWGTFLHILASEVGGTFLELGSCAGISGSYLAAAPTCKRLITIEGSPALAQLADETTSSVAPNRVEVIAGLFNNVLDRLLPDLGSNTIEGGRKKARSFMAGHEWLECSRQKSCHRVELLR